MQCECGRSGPLQSDTRPKAGEIERKGREQAKREGEREREEPQNTKNSKTGPAPERTAEWLQEDVSEEELFCH